MTKHPLYIMSTSYIFDHKAVVAQWNKPHWLLFKPSVDIITIIVYCSRTSKI